jgi:spore coat protein U-like protein
MRRAALASAAVLLALAATALVPPAHPQGKGKGGGGGGGGSGTRCTISSAPPIAFGLYDSESPVPRASSGELRFSCTPNKTLTVKVTIGPSAASGSIDDRRMRELGGDDQLRYNVFQDARGTIIWGDGVSGGSAAFVTGKGDFSAQVYGVAPPRQSVGEGLYIDALRVTILP